MSDASTAPAPLPGIEVKPATVADLRAALAAGLADFRRAPQFGLFFGAIYTVGGLLIVLSVMALGLSYLAYPLAAGFALIGPFVAVGLYEVSRRLEDGRTLTWGGILGVIFAQGRRELGWMAFVTLFILLMWMYVVRLLLALFLGFQSFASMQEFITVLLTTVDGLTFLAVGHVVGAGLACVLFSLTVVSFPLLLDQDRDFITAMITSVRAVVESPVVMLGWGLTIAVFLLLAMVPGFLGLLIVLPVLGHATWHLYRRLVSYRPAG